MIEKGNDYEYATAAPDRYNLLKEFAKKNRKEMTRSETTLWNALRKLACGFRFRRQHPIGDFIADFICLERRLVIEVDGAIIARRNSKMTMRFVLNFSSIEVLQSFDSPMMKLTETFKPYYKR